MTFSEKKTFLITDSGLYSELCNGLGKNGDLVKYYTPFHASFFPKYSDYVIGKGFEHIEKIKYFFDEIDKSDCIGTFEVGGNDLIAFIRKHFPSKPCFGSGHGQKLEDSRWSLKKVLKDVGLISAAGVKIKGVHALSEYLLKNPDKFVKVDIFRGTINSFHSKDYKSVEQLIEYLEHELGGFSEDFEFVVEDTIPSSQEWGVDTFFWGEDYVKPYMYGVELDKDCYIGKVVDTLPKPLQETMNKLKPVLKELDWRGCISTEEKIVSKDKHYFLDICARCYDDKTEILTNSGWKLFKDLRDNDSVATLNLENNNIEYQIPEEKQQYDYSGDLISIGSNGDSVDLMVTPNHNVLVRKQWSKKYGFNRADELKYGDKIPRTGIWKGLEQNWFILPQYKNTWNSGRYNKPIVGKVCNPLKIKMDDWLSFIGIYIAEGNANYGTTNITQLTKIKQVKNILDKLPYKYKFDGKTFRISNIQLSNYLGQLGLCNEKEVPSYVFDLSPRQINIFLDAYCLGDGHIRYNGARKFYTTSEKLANGIQELLLKINSVGNINIKRVAGTIAKFPNGKEYKRRYDIYTIQERISQKQFCIDNRLNHITKQKYNGRVYCVTVPKYNVIYVRRNGRPCWCGNSPNPLGLFYPEFIENWPEMVFKIASKMAVKADLRHKYVGCVPLYSKHTRKSDVQVNFPPKLRKNVKFMTSYCKDGHYYAIKNSPEEIVAVVVAGDQTVDGLIKQLKKYVDEVDCYGIERSACGGLDKIVSIIKSAKEIGIDF